MPGALVGPFGRYELGADIVTIGRSSSNKLVINDNQVSGRHLQVLPQGAEYVLVDVGSSNGTTLNGQPLPPQRPQPLRSGDVIVIGTTRLIVELAPAAFQAAQGPAPQGEIIFSPPQQQSAFPPALDEPAFPGNAPPRPAPPQYGAPPMFPPPNFGAPPTQDVPFSPAGFGAPPQGAPFRPAGLPPQPPGFGPYPGNAPGPAPVQQPDAGAPWAAPPTYGGAPGVGVGLPPARAKSKQNRLLLLVGGLVALVVIGVIIGVIFLKFVGGQQAAQATPTPRPSATQQAITPFYTDLEKQDYTAATRLVTADYLQQLGGTQQLIKFFQKLDQDRGKISAFTVGPLSGSGSPSTADVNVTRDPAKGAFKPDILELTLVKGKWQISQWMPGQRQS